jgi:hypothetical protein
MNRTVIAFFIAPLWVPLIVAPYAALVLFPYPAQWHWIIITVVLSATFTYLGVFALGFPAFRVLRSRNLTALWIAAGLGFIVGAVTWAVFMACFALSLGEGLHGVHGALSSHSIFVLLTGLLGMLVGTTFWLIARADFWRNESPHPERKRS